MPAAAGATQIHGVEAMDLSVVLQLLKKGIVLIPLVIMFLIFFIRHMLVFPDDENKEGIMNNMPSIGDQTFHHIRNDNTSRITTNLANANDTLTFRDYLLASSFDANVTVNT